jgi:hypothetical protein
MSLRIFLYVSYQLKTGKYGELTIHGDRPGGRTEVLEHLDLPVSFISDFSQSTEWFLGTTNPPLLFR